MKIQMPLKCARVLWDPLNRRYRVLYGGRGSAKSWSAARYLLLRASAEKLRILCTREIQTSIKDSVYRLLVDQIYELNLSSAFIIKSDGITGRNGSEFIFKGLARNIAEVKSTEGVNICWVEEADRVSFESWKVLIPTIREPGSFFIVTFNPEEEKSATYTRFVGKRDPQGVIIPVENPAVCRSFVNFWDNRWFPETLHEEMEWDKKNDPELYRHVWCGEIKEYGNAVIFRDKVKVDTFEAPEGARFYFGEDFGFAGDPMALIRMFVQDQTLFIDHEAYGAHIELNEMHAFMETVPEVHKWEIIADNARPETISHLASPTIDGLHEGFQIVACEKGKGSVADGIAFLRKFKAIVIHPRCKGTIKDFSNYRYKTDPITNQILPIPVDKANHSCDAARYGLEKKMKGGATIYDVL